ncbi:CHAT domain-containing protein [Mycena galericulata]|nr:CHAT domain-containing protein [Mycena galericulata]
MQSGTIQQGNENSWLQLLSENGLLQINSLTAYDGRPNVEVEVESRLDDLDSGVVSATGVLSVVQALIAQAQQGGVVDIDHAEQTRFFAADLVRDCPPGNCGRQEALFLAVVAAVIVNWQTGQKEDLDDLITHLLALLEITTDPRASLGVLTLLAGALFKRFTLQRNLDDLDATCDYLITALALYPNDIRCAPTLTKLGVAFSTRFEMVGRMSDLEKAIQYHRQSLALIPAEDENRPTSLHHLANDLVKRFEHLEDNSDLDEALELQRECLQLLPETDPMLVLALVSIGRTLIVRVRRFTGQPSIDEQSDISNAVQYHRDALALCPLEPPSQRSPQNSAQRVMCLSSFVFCLRVGVEKLSGWRGTDVVEEAIHYGTEVQTLLPEGHPSLVGIQRDLGFLHLHLAEPSLDRAFHLFRRAVGEETGSAKDRLSAAVDWASSARLYGHPSTEDAYSAAMQQLNRCLVAYSTVDSQHEFLARPLTRMECATLVADAASFAIDHDRTKQAVEIIEQGRTFIWSRMRGYRHPLDQLRQADRDRAEEFQRLSGEVERFAVTFDSTSFSSSLFHTFYGTSTTGPVLTGSLLRRKLASQWREKLEDIRANVAGFREFLHPLPFLRLRRAAVDGPVIILNHSSHRSDALIVLKKAQAPICVPLPGDMGALWRLQDAIGGYMYVRSARLFSNKEGIPRTEENTAVFLRAIWRGIVEPIVAALRLHGILEMSRIWWCPTGMLGTFPVHAAGQYDGAARNLPDLYISSYTPTLSALITAREALKGDNGDTPNLLIVGASGTTGYSPLPHVHRECEIARSFVPDGKDLLDSEAKSATVLAELPNHSWVHFASHAVQSIRQPLDSSIILHDNELLRLRHFMMAHPPRARLAFLSACESAAVSTSTPDEVLHLSAAIQFSGFCSVVGSLWYMMDNAGPDLTEAFYSFLLRDGLQHVVLKDSAEALNKATRELRKKGMRLEHWANFVHIGV